MGVLGEYGFSGILRGAAIGVFFAFLGFDAVSTAAQRDEETRSGTCLSASGLLLVYRALYGFCPRHDGVAHYTAFSGQQGIVPAAIAIEHMGQADAPGIIQPDYPWLNRAIVPLSILFGYCSVIMVTLLGQSRVFLSEPRHLLPPSSRISTKVPYSGIAATRSSWYL